MAEKNEITGATLATKHLSGEAKKAYNEAWDRTFGEKKPEPVWVLGEDATEVHQDETADVVSDMKPQCCGCCGEDC